MSKRTAPGASAAALLRGKPCLKQPAPAPEPLLRRSSESNSPWGGQPSGLLGERLPLQLQLRRRWHPWGPGAVPRQVQALLAQPAPRTQGKPPPDTIIAGAGGPGAPRTIRPRGGVPGGSGTGFVAGALELLPWGPSGARLSSLKKSLCGQKSHAKSLCGSQKSCLARPANLCVAGQLKNLCVTKFALNRSALVRPSLPAHIGRPEPPKDRPRPNQAVGDAWGAPRFERAESYAFRCPVFVGSAGSARMSEIAS